MDNPVCDTVWHELFSVFQSWLLRQMARRSRLIYRVDTSPQEKLRKAAYHRVSIVIRIYFCIILERVTILQPEQDKFPDPGGWG